VISAEGGFTGNDVVDLAVAREREPLDREWVDRHLTSAERVRFSTASRESLPLLFWAHFAAKEAASKALAQGGLDTPQGAYPMLDVDLAWRRVTHLPSGEEAHLLLDTNPERIHAIALWRAESSEPEDLLCEVARLPEEADPSDYVRERLLETIGQRRGASPDTLTIASRDGIPLLLERGRWLDWSVSLSHAGGFVAWSCLAR
jgi:phosphopantetheinyl transferase (holo-ACP synthase)